MGSLTHTVGGSDNLVNFKSAARVPIESAKLYFHPVQDGEGDPSPENVRPITGWNSSTLYKAGKNIGHVVGYSARSTESPTGIKYADGNYGNSLSTINYTYPDTPVTITQTQWPNVSSITNYRNGYCTIIIDNLIFGQRYDFSFKVSNITNNPLNVSISQIDITGPSGNNYSAPSEIINEDTLVFRNVAFNSHDMYQNRSEVNIYYCGMSFTLSEFMVTPANMSDGVFEPYCGDIIPITFPVVGKNLFGGTFVSGNVTTADGAIAYYNYLSNRVVSDYVYLEAGTYTFSTNEAFQATIYFYTEPNLNGYIYGEQLQSWADAPRTFTIIGSRYVVFVLRKSDNSSVDPTDISEIQLERGSSKTSYEPYSSDNTIYGGYVDVAAGEVVAEYAKIVLDGDIYSGHFTMITDSDNVNRFSISPDNLGAPLPVNRTSNVYYNYLKTGNTYQPWCGFVGSAGAILFYTPKSIDSKNVLLSYLSEHPLEIVYRINNPIHYPLSKIQLKSFLSYNNVWSNTNDVAEVSYALHDTGPIRASKRRIAMNQPHIETASGSIANFRTDVSAPLKECKVTFMPVQSGTGDPSPSNVRPIIGWTGINAWKSEKNLVHIIGYSTTSINNSSSARSLMNIYGTTINTIDYTIPDTPLVITQSQWPREDVVSSYSNGYIVVGVDNLIFGQSYDVSLKISNIVSNPLNANIEDMRIYVPSGSTRTPVKDGDRLIFKNVSFDQNSTRPQMSTIDLRICGMSFTLSEFMVTAVGEDDRIFEPYSGVSIPVSFPQQGKNYFNADTTSKTERGMTWTANNDHTITVSGTPTNYTYIMTGMFEIPTSGKICLSGLDGVTNVAWDNYYIYNSSKTLLQCTGGGGTGYKVVNLDNYDDPKYMILAFKRNGNNVEASGTIKPQVEIGETPTAYEPYTTTIYGGYVDVAAGELVAEWEYASARWGDIKSTNPNANTGFYRGIIDFNHVIHTLHSQKNDGESVRCNVCNLLSWNAGEYSPEHFFGDSDRGTGRIYLYGNYDDDLIIQFVVKLAEPIHYSLSQQTMKSLKGINNIWSDANGNVEVKYWKH